MMHLGQNCSKRGQGGSHQWGYETLGRCLFETVGRRSTKFLVVTQDTGPVSEVPVRYRYTGISVPVKCDMVLYRKLLTSGFQNR